MRRKPPRTARCHVTAAVTVNTDDCQCFLVFSSLLKTLLAAQERPLWNRKTIHGQFSVVLEALWHCLKGGGATTAYFRPRVI